MNPPPGVIVLRGGSELFNHPDVIGFYRYVLNEWRPPPERKIALYMGCTAVKPYSRSFIHLKVIRMLEKHNLAYVVQQYIISEPMILVPRELENKYPVANYDFPKHLLDDKGKEIFVKRLRIILDKVSKFHIFHVAFMPRHHLEIFTKAGKGILDKFIYVPYNVYFLPNLLRELKLLHHYVNEEVQDKRT